MAVPEQLRNVRDWRSSADLIGSELMPERVQARLDPHKLAEIDNPLPEQIGANQASIPVRENEPGILNRISQFRDGFGVPCRLLLPVVFENPGETIAERNNPLVAVLRRLQGKAFTGLVDGELHQNLSILEIDLCPVQSGDLPAAHSGMQSDGDDGKQVGSVRGLEDERDLTRLQRPRRPLRGLGTLQTGDRILNNEPTLHCELEHAESDSPGVSDALRR